MEERQQLRNEERRITEIIIGAFFAVYNELGPGLLETVYRNAMRVELGYRGLESRAEVPFELAHRGVPIGTYRADLLIEDVVIVECKSALVIHPAHLAQVVTYLKASRLQTGLLLNFGAKAEMRRVDR